MMNGDERGQYIFFAHRPSDVGRGRSEKYILSPMNRPR